MCPPGVLPGLKEIGLVTIGMFDLVTTMMQLNQGFGESNPRIGTSVIGSVVGTRVW